MILFAIRLHRIPRKKKYVVIPENRPFLEFLLALKRVQKIDQVAIED